MTEYADETLGVFANLLNLEKFRVSTVLLVSLITNVYSGLIIKLDMSPVATPEANVTYLGFVL